jgi:uncharacterized membrane protein HdeD (DUF308 family)
MISFPDLPTALKQAEKRREEAMKPITISGILLIVFGILVFVYQGVSYTKREKVLDIGPIEATRETHKTIPLPPILGGLAVAGGIAMVVMGGKRAS